MKKKLFYLVQGLLIGGGLVFALSTSFGIKPDLHLWNWFGYEFGLDFTSRMPLLRLAYMVAGGSILFWLAHSIDKSEAASTNKIQTKEQAKVKEAA